jgi:hypothetical protein
LEIFRKALGKLGNIVLETFVIPARFFMFPQMFPCFPTLGNIVAETKFASREAKMFPQKNYFGFSKS